MSVRNSMKISRTIFLLAYFIFYFLPQQASGKTPWGCSAGIPLVIHINVKIIYLVMTSLPLFEIWPTGSLCQSVGAPQWDRDCETEAGII